jgi:hypothetical protein
MEVSVRVPIQALEDGRMRVRLDVHSATMRAYCEAILRADGATLLEDDDKGADIALIEIGADDVQLDTKELRGSFPSARIIALGAPINPEAYDAVAPTPIQPKTLRDAIGRSRNATLSGG